MIINIKLEVKHFYDKSMNSKINKLTVAFQLEILHRLQDVLWSSAHLNVMFIWTGVQKKL